jgi:hypothetical protein
MKSVHTRSPQKVYLKVVSKKSNARNDKFVNIINML